MNHQGVFPFFQDFRVIPGPGGGKDALLVSQVFPELFSQMRGHGRKQDQIGFGDLTFQAEANTPYRLDLIVPGDFDLNSSADMADFAIFASAWLTGPTDAPWNPDCDISIPTDDFVDARDLAVFAENWLTGTE